MNFFQLISQTQIIIGNKQFNEKCPNYKTHIYSFIAFFNSDSD